MFSSAKSKEHFVDTKGMVLFDDGEDEQIIEVPLVSTSKFDDFVEFKVVLIEPQGKCSLGNNQKCYVRLLPPEAKFVFSEKYLTYRKLVGNEVSTNSILSCYTTYL